jgi:hypothetical protein
VQLFVVARFFVETKGVSLEDIDVRSEAIETGSPGGTPVRDRAAQ